LKYEEASGFRLQEGKIARRQCVNMNHVGNAGSHGSWYTTTSDRIDASVSERRGRAGLFETAPPILPEVSMPMHWITQES